MTKWTSCLRTLTMFFAVALSKDCNVLDYGAVGDGKTLDTTAIQTAINNCSRSSNGTTRIIFPSGYNFLTFPFQIIESNTHLVINSTITAPMDYKNWPIESSTRYQPLISSNEKNSNSKVTGYGLINGNGYYWYPLFKNNTLKYQRPWLLRFYDMFNFEISHLHLLNSPAFHIYCSGNNVTIHNINISVIDPETNQPGNYDVAPNTDGIDVGGDNMHIYDCFISNGDDSYTIESGSNNILIENSTCINGLGLGMPSAKGSKDKPTQNSLYRNMIAINTGWGIRLKSGEPGGNQYNGTFENITYYNITFVNVTKAIDINVYNESVFNSYTGDTGNMMDKTGNTAAIRYTKVKNIVFEDIKGSYTDYAGHLDCSNSPPCTGLVFEDVHLVNHDKSTNSVPWQCSANVYGIATNVTPALDCLQK